MPKNKTTNAASEDQKPFTDEHTDKRIHEHLMNVNDTISEDDIRSVITNVDIVSPGPSPKKKGKK